MGSSLAATLASVLLTGAALGSAGGLPPRVVREAEGFRVEVRFVIDLARAKTAKEYSFNREAGITPERMHL